MSKNSLIEAGAKYEIKSFQLASNQNHLVRKQTLKHFAKLAKRLSCVLSTYLYGAFDYMFFLFHVRVDMLRTKNIQSNAWNR